MRGAVRGGRSALLAAGILFGVLPALVPASADGQEVERYTLGGPDAAVFNLAGSVRVEGGSGSDIVVEVRRGGDDAGRLSVETGEVAGLNALRVIYPSDRIVYREGGDRFRTTLRVNEDGTFGHRERRRGAREVRIEGSGRGLEAHADLTVRVPRGKELRIFQGVGEIRAENVDGELHLDGAASPVRATGIRGLLSVDVGSGRVEVTDAEGEVNVDTGSGSVDVTGIRGRSLRVDTGSGTVTGGDISVDEVNIDTGSGGIGLSALRTRRGRLDTGSGSIEVELGSDVEELVIDTGSGSVTAVIPDGFGAELEVETGSGGIDLGFPVQVRRVERDHIRGTIGDGGGRLVIDTGSGSVTLRRR